MPLDPHQSINLTHASCFMEGGSATDDPFHTCYPPCRFVSLLSTSSLLDDESSWRIIWTTSALQVNLRANVSRTSFRTVIRVLDSSIAQIIRLRTIYSASNSSGAGRNIFTLSEPDTHLTYLAVHYPKTLEPATLTGQYVFAFYNAVNDQLHLLFMADLLSLITHVGFHDI